MKKEFLCASALLFSTSSFAMEETVRITDALWGIYTYDDTKKDQPTVLLLHGYASHKNEVGDYYKKFAEKLLEEGIASLRIDFRGYGDSSIPSEISTLDTMIEDTKDTWQWLNEQEQTGPLFLHGFSLGGAIASSMASQLKPAPKAVSLWSPAYEFRLEEIQKYADQAQKDGVVEIDLGWRKIKHSAEFFALMNEETYSPSHIQNYKNPVYVLYGEDDELIEGRKKFEAWLDAQQIEFNIYPNVGHVLGSFSEEASEIQDDIIKQSVAFIKQSVAFIKENN